MLLDVVTESMWLVNNFLKRISKCSCYLAVLFIKKFKRKPLWLPVPPPIPLERGKERSSKSRGNATRATASPASTSRSEELTQSRHRGLTVDQVWSSSRQEQPLEMIPKSMILFVILSNSVLKLSYTMYKWLKTVNHFKIYILIST